MHRIDRGVVIIKPRQPFLDWVNRTYQRSPPVNMEDLERDCTSILVPDLYSLQDMLDYLEPLKPRLFEMQLEGWFLDPQTWPDDRGNATFDAWFRLEAHSMVWDPVKAPIVKAKDFLSNPFRAGGDPSAGVDRHPVPADPADAPARLHAYSRYMCVTERLIDALQQDYLAGRSVGHSVPGFDPTLATIIVAESLEADHEWDTFPQRIAGTAPPRPRSAPLSDWSRAALAELLFEAADLAKSTGNTERQGDLWALAWASLDELLQTPTVSPMLWYEDIFFDVAQELRQIGDREAIDYLQRGLAHNLHHDEGRNAANMLRDLAQTYLMLDDLDRGLAMLAALLRDDPSDIWTYNLMAITFEGFGLAELGAQAAQRGLDLITTTGDREELRDQLQNALQELQASQDGGREAQVKPQLLAELRAALRLDFDAGQRRPVAELCRELVPNLDRLPVKRPREKPDLPPPDEGARRLAGPPAGRKPGRNDPCWCGSGKKYKHCHLRSDRRQQRS